MEGFRLTGIIHNLPGDKISGVEKVLQDKISKQGFAFSQSEHSSLEFLHQIDHYDCIVKISQRDIH